MHLFEIIYSCDIKPEYSEAITPFFIVTFTFRNHSNNHDDLDINVGNSRAA